MMNSNFPVKLQHCINLHIFFSIWAFEGALNLGFKIKSIFNAFNVKYAKKSMNTMNYSNDHIIEVRSGGGKLITLKSEL